MAAQTTDHTVDPSDVDVDPSENDQADAGEDDEVEQPEVEELEDATGEEEDPLELDDVFHILQNERRRQVLLRLKDVDGTVRMREIAEQIAAWENDTTVENLYSDQRQRVYIALYQSHLPKLDDLGVIEYNQSRGTIDPTPRVDQVVQYLEPDTASSGGIQFDVSDRTEAVGPAGIAGGTIGILALVAVLTGLFVSSVVAIGLAGVVVGMALMMVGVSLAR